MNFNFYFVSLENLTPLIPESVSLCRKRERPACKQEGSKDLLRIFPLLRLYIM